MTRSTPSCRWRSLVASLLSVLGLSPFAGLSAPPAQTTRLLYDPFCAVTQTGAAIPLRPLPSGTQRMVERLAQIARIADPATMAFLVHRQVPMLRERLDAAVDLPEQTRIRFRLAQRLIQAGDPLAALQELDALDASLADPAAQLQDFSPSQRRLDRAIAFLRLGEIENCLTQRTADSCLLPIRTEAIHRFPRGSLGAISVLTEMLETAPGDLRARWLFNVAAMTLGDWPERVPAPWLIPPHCFAAEHPLPRFPDVAPRLGLAVDDLAGGCVVDDFDNDGLLDVVASAWGLSSPLRLFRNAGNGQFVERSAQAGLFELVGALNIQQTDYNNDGWLDLWLLRGGWLGTAGRIPNSLLRNNRDGTFTDVTEEAGLLRPHPTQTSTWFDFDGDGWLDLFIGNETWTPHDPDLCELYRNNRDGTFTECARESGLVIARLIKGVASADYDNDGRPDLFLSCLDGPNLLFRNEGPANTHATGTRPWRFRDVTRAAGLDDPIYSFPTWFFDYDNDGNEDLLVSGYRIEHVGDVAADYLGIRHTAGARLRLFRNLGNGTFTNVTAAVRLDRLAHAMGANFGDLDNDGWLDFYLGTGDPDLATLIPNRMFRNDQGLRFQDVTSAGGFGHLQKGHAVAFADLDHDGDQDVYTVIGGAYSGDRYANALFLNPGTTNRWLKLHCLGTRSNRAAIGARIKIAVQTPAGPRNIYKTVSSGGSFGSSPLRQEIGLGNATSIVSVDVFWPASGLRQVFTGLELDRAYQVRERDPIPVPLRLPRIPLSAPLPLEPNRS